MENRRRKKRNTRITFVHLLPLILMGALFVYFVARKGLGRFAPQFDPSQFSALVDRGLKSIGTPHIVALVIVMVIYIYLLPGNAWRLDNLLFPKRESRRKRISSMQGQMDTWQPKLTPETAAASIAPDSAPSTVIGTMPLTRVVGEPMARGGGDAAESSLQRAEHETGVNSAKPERVG